MKHGRWLQLRRLSPRSLSMVIAVAVLLSITPILGIALHDALSEQQHYREKLEDRAQVLSQQTAAIIGRYISATTGTLELLALTAAEKDARDELLQGLLRDSKAQRVELSNISIVNPDGTHRLSALQAAAPSNLADRPWFRRVQQHRRFALGGFQVGRISGVPSINLAVPIPNADRTAPLSMVQAGLKLSALDAVLNEIPAEAGMSLILLDRDGLVLAERGNNLHEPGKCAWSPRPDMQSGGSELKDPDGVTRTYFFTRVPNADEGLWIALGLNSGLADFHGRTLFWELFWLLMIPGLIAVLVVLLIVEHTVLRPVRQLLQATQRIIAGDWSARADLRSGALELRELGVTLDILISVTAHQVERIKWENEQNRRSSSELQSEVDLKRGELEKTSQQLLAEVVMRQGTDAALRKSEATSRTFLEAIPESAILLDARGVVLMANEVFARRIRKERSAIIGRELPEVVPEVLRPQHAAALSRVLETAEPVTFDVGFEGRRVQVSYTPVLGPDKEVQGIAILGFDITERHLMDERLRRTVEELETAMKDIKQLSCLLPICASCKKIRDDKGYWNQLEQYLWTHSEIRFSHGICPDCMRRLYPDDVEPARDPADGAARSG